MIFWGGAVLQTPRKITDSIVNEGVRCITPIRKISVAMTTHWTSATPHPDNAVLGGVFTGAGR